MILPHWDATFDTLVLTTWDAPFCGCSYIALPIDPSLELGIIIRAAMRLPEAKWFLAPVDERDAPKYFEVIAHPMDLGTIGRYITEGRYGSVEDMVADVGTRPCLIVYIRPLCTSYRRVPL